MDYSVYSTITGLILRPTEDARNTPEHLNSLWDHLGPDEDIWPGEALSDLEWRIDLETRLPVPHTPDKTHRELVRDIVAERQRRLSAGFDFDFGGIRGVHRIGTTEDDERGWDKVTMIAQALLNTGTPGGSIAIVTNTGPVLITALEWQQVLLAAAAFQQPIFARSFELQAMDPIPQDVAAPTWWEEP